MLDLVGSAATALMCLALAAWSIPASTFGAMHRDLGGELPPLTLTLPVAIARGARCCTRPELFEDSATCKPITFHDLRATGLTWMAIRGDTENLIMRRAGHTRSETTQGYIREAENLRAGFGEVFPPLARLPDSGFVTSFVP